MRALSIVLLVLLVLAAPGPVSAEAGWSALTRAELNVRKGPGIHYPAIGLISRNSRILVHGCGYPGHWCSITHRAKTGFVSGRYLVRLGRAQRPRLGTPRERVRLLQTMRSRTRPPLAHRRPFQSDDLHVPWHFRTPFKPEHLGYPLYGYPRYGYRPYGHERYGYRLYGYR